jgi:hypothetical protein
LDEPEPEPHGIGGLSESDVPQIVVSRLVGGVLGVIVFAGIVGGFLVASTNTGNYIPHGAIFTAFLGGVFSSKFFQRLSAASDGRFSTQDRQQQREPQPPRPGQPPQRARRAHG